MLDTSSSSTPTEGFGPLLRDLRTRAGLTRERLAEASGVSVRALADLERGRSRGPHRRTVQALAGALQLDPDTAGELEKAADLGRPRSRPDTAPPAPAAAGLPRDIGDFTARGQAIAALAELARQATPAQPLITVVSGQPGLGKTAFAVHAAHQLAPLFPHGQLVLDLHGMDPEPTSAHDALAQLLRALGTEQSAVPASTEERSGLLRRLLRERRLLLLLDNAAGEQQVRPLLPDTGPCLTIVTSRHALAGLEAVHRTDLGLLRREEAVDLLTRILGPERVRQEAQAARNLADLCGGLPLAVRIAGQRLAARPHEHLAKLADQLAQENRRLDTLRAGDLQIRAAFALSYRQLAPAARTVLRRATLAGGSDFSARTAALLADLSLDEATRCAEDLADAGLLHADAASERYRFHDLLRLFAAEQLALEDEPAVRAAALERTARFTLRRATAAALYFDADPRHNPAVLDPDPASAPADRDQARHWLDSERDQWFAALHHAHTAGHHRQVLDAADSMHWFSDINQHWELWVPVFQYGVAAARALAGRHDEAVQLNYLAWAYNTCVHDHRAALSTAQEALDAAHETADDLQSGWALGYAATALHRLGRTEEAVARLRLAAALLAEQTTTQGRLAHLSTLNLLGTHLRHLGRAEEALATHRRSEALCLAEHTWPQPELTSLYLAVTRQHIGNDLAALDRCDQAEQPLRQALATFENANLPALTESVRLDLGIVLRRLALHPEAQHTLHTAHTALRALNSPRQAQAAAELHHIEERDS